MNSGNYVYVDIFDIPDVMKVRTQYKVASEAIYSSPRIAYDGIVKLAEEIQPFVRHMKQRDFGTDEYIITDTLFVIPPDCKRLAIPLEEPKKGKWEKQLTRHFLDSRANVGVEMKEATGRGYHTYVNLKCTNCNKVTIVSESILYKFCPHCGAEMTISEPYEEEVKK